MQAFPRLLAPAGALWPQTLLACPFCQGPVGEQVSAGIFNSSFWLNLALTLMPVPALLLAAAVVHFGLVWRERHAIEGDRP